MTLGYTLGWIKYFDSLPVLCCECQLDWYPVPHSMDPPDYSQGFQSASGSVECLCFVWATPLPARSLLLPESLRLLLPSSLRKPRLFTGIWGTLLLAGSPLKVWVNTASVGRGKEVWYFVYYVKGEITHWFHPKFRWIMEFRTSCQNIVLFQWRIYIPSKSCNERCGCDVITPAVNKNWPLTWKCS